MELNVNVPITGHPLVDAHVAELHRVAAVRRQRGRSARAARSRR